MGYVGNLWINHISGIYWDNHWDRIEDAEQTWFPKVQNMLFSLLFSMNR